MSNEGISEEERRFITDHINSVEQLEVLLFLYNNASKEWSAAEVGHKLRIDQGSAAGRMADLHSQGLLVSISSQPPLYRYNPKTSDLDRAVSSMSRTYSKHRYSVINLIFSKPIDKIRTFSDSLKPEKGDKD